MTLKGNTTVSPEILTQIQNEAFNKSELVAEFIDNSISSFIKNRNLFPNDYVLKIHINFDQDEITIQDNAAGLTSEECERCFNYANSSGRSNEGYNFWGVGMKEAALWFGNSIEIITNSAVDKQGYKTKYILSEVIERFQKEKYFIEFDIIEYSLNGTTIKISDLNDQNYFDYSEELIYQICADLAILYKLLLEREPIEIIINGIKVKYIEPTVQTAPFIDEYANRKKKCIINSESPTYKWEIQNIYAEYKHQNETYTIQGKIYLLEFTGTTHYYTKEDHGILNNIKKEPNGIRVYRKGKGIIGCLNQWGDDQPLVKSIGSVGHRRFAGEFEVSDNIIKPKVGESLQSNQINILKELFSIIETNVREGKYNKYYPHNPHISSILHQATNWTDKVRTYPQCSSINKPVISNPTIPKPKPIIKEPENSDIEYEPYVYDKLTIHIKLTNEHNSQYFELNSNNGTFHYKLYNQNKLIIKNKDLIQSYLYLVSATSIFSSNTEFIKEAIKKLYL